MTDQPPVASEPHEREPDDEAAPMPRWVPIAIGVVLVTLAALAVVTGMRYRDQTLVRIVQPRHRTIRTTAPAPPGEPEPGASLMFPGDASNVPPAHEPVAGSSRAEITGGPGGVNRIMRLSARRGMRMNVTPSDAVVYVNDIAIGQASQFDSEDEEYDFAAPGSYTIRLVAPGYRERAFLVTAADNAQDEVAKIDAKLERQ
ncbi:MAG TPA: hypothetical protein VLV78_12205 [Thermoanaerobaculia bacterium]|nr:hypothetical protein [Thermoanaerobaculia bacterium]